MGEYKNTIERGYQTYVNEFPNHSAFNIGGVDYPFQEYVLENNTNLIGYNESELEQDCLVELRTDIPNVSDLPLHDLGWLPIGATRILKVQRVPDHDAMWKVAAKVLDILNQSDKSFPKQLVSKTVTVVRAVLASEWGLDYQNASDWSKSANQRHTLREASVLARHMAYPTVEGLVKALCRRDIEMSGKVRPNRELLSYPSSNDNYHGDNGDRVNNLGHLLWHLEQDVAEGPLQTRMEEFRGAVKDFYKISESDDIGVYGYFSNQRNTALHGEARTQAESGIILNLLSLLIFNIDYIPEHRRKPP
jgi:hypothetical protein